MKQALARSAFAALPFALTFAICAMELAHAATLTRTSSFEYDPATGLLIREIVEPDNNQLRLETAYDYDAYGNKTAITTSSPAFQTARIATRTSGAAYDSRNQFPVSGTNPLGHVETRETDARFGLPTKLTGPNGLVTQWQYDDFGRKTREIRADGTQTKWTYTHCVVSSGGNSTCAASTARYVIETTPLATDGVTVNGPATSTYYDALNRAVLTKTLGFDGSVIYQKTEYDSLGRVYSVSRPYYAGQAQQLTTSTYDDLDRVVATRHPDGTETTATYNGLSSSITNALGQKQIKLKNSQGQLVKVTDPANQSLAYAYDPFGNLIKTIDPLGNVITLAYNLRGHKVQMTDPNMGTWYYEYNVLGELVKQTDAKGQVTTLVHDVLGRMTSRKEPDLVSTWTYDNCAKGIGKLCSATADNGYARTLSYDSLGRPVSVNTTIDGAYATSVTYDAHGRMATQTYPTGLAVKYGYTSLGYLWEVRNNATNALYWRADTMDAEGHLQMQTYGNGIITQQVFRASTGRIESIYAGAGNSVQNLTFSYDSIGNLVSRGDANQNFSETFLHDRLNRLTNSTVNAASGIVSQGFTYDTIGNITYRPGIGTYSYGGVNNRPHAVSEIALPGKDRFTPGGKRKYTYDANGNLTDEIELDSAGAVVAGKSRTHAYTSFNMPSSLGGANVTLSFAYSPEHQRIKQIAPGGTTIYLHPDNAGGLSYEKETKADGAIEHRHFISAGGGVVAQVKQTGTATSVNYFHRDALGSTTAVTDGTGAVIERLAYEPFGKRRFPDGRADNNNTVVGTSTDRGYTNHEHLDELGLIHMNGRIYDPMLARFMTADPLVDGPDNLQSYNRYAYVTNSPFLYTDPTGYFKWSKFRNKYLRPIVAIAVGWYLGPVGINIAGNALGSSMIAGAASGAIATGTVKGAMQGAAAAALFYGAGSFSDAMATSSGNAAAWAEGSIGRGLAHAAAGCASASMGGGNCGTGALSAGVSHMGGHAFKTDSMVANVVTHAVIGGTTSAIGGGKFENGAVTGAFGYLFNELAHQTTMEQRGYPTNWYERAEWDMAKAGVTSDGCLTFSGTAMCFGPGAIKGVGSVAAKILNAERIGSGLKADASHRAASFLAKEQLEVGKVFPLRGGDGVERTLLQTPGGFNGKNGIYEYIYDSAGKVTHQRFIEGGTVTGLPNQRILKGR